MRRGGGLYERIRGNPLLRRGRNVQSRGTFGGMQGLGISRWRHDVRGCRLTRTSGTNG